MLPASLALPNVMNIIESISQAGIKVTPASMLHSRLNRPSPGDPVDVSLMGDNYASISGGPWQCIPLHRLVWSGALRTQWFWNWGSLGAGAGHACYYGIQRPVFVLLPEGADRNNPPPIAPAPVSHSPEALAVLAWCVRQMQGESGTGHTYWAEEHPDYAMYLRAVELTKHLP